MFWAARAVLLIQVIPIILCFVFNSILPVLFFGLPRFYGAFIQFSFIALQHAGLPENEWDHRANCRSLKLSPILSFLYMNMENHIEHHIYPMVPFHALPKLSKRISSEMPPRYKSLFGSGYFVLMYFLQPFSGSANPGSATWEYRSYPNSCH